MLVLTIRTDKPEAEIGLYDDRQQLTYKTWLADRQLAETIHQTIKHLLDSQQRSWQNIGGIVVYQGPGSFTGLRIGLTVANALAVDRGKPIVATSNDNWLMTGIERLLDHQTDGLARPEYGAPVHITLPKH